MPDTEHIRQFLLQNKAATNAGKANLIDWVGIDKEGEITLIKFEAAKVTLLKGENNVER